MLFSLHIHLQARFFLKKMSAFGICFSDILKQIHELEVRYMTAEKVRISFEHYIGLHRIAYFKFCYYCRLPLL